MKYKVSIIVPVFKVEKYLAECLDSLVNQTLKDIEIIVINDASPDNCLTIMQDYQNKYPQLIKVENLKENVGPGFARNHGLDVAHGEYVAFVDSDDWVDLKFCELLYKKAKDFQADMVVFNHTELYDSSLDTGIPPVLRENDQKYFKRGQLSVDKKNYIDKTAVAAWFKLYRLALWDKIRFPDCGMEDAAVSGIVVARANKIIKLSESLYFYRRRQDSITKTDEGKDLVDYFYKSLTNRIDNIEFVMSQLSQYPELRQYEPSFYRNFSKMIAQMFKKKVFKKLSQHRGLKNENVIAKHFLKIENKYPGYKEKLKKHARIKHRLRLARCFRYLKEGIS